MRLAQLSRKLALRPVEIVDFLAKQDIQIDEGSNTRLEDAHVTLIMKHFAPAMLNEVEAELAAEIAEEVMIENTVHTETVVDAVAVESFTFEAQPDQIFEGKEDASPALIVSESIEQQSEVIRAPKVELPGLKVIGKIEIPQPKKKEVSVKDSELPQPEAALPAPTDAKRKGYEDRRPANKRREERPRRNPIAAQREREAMEAEQKRREAAEREKEKRTRNYLKKVKASQPVKPARLVKEQVVDMSTELNDTPKTWWGRFKKWLKS